MAKLPLIGALAVVLHRERVLLVQRGKEPDAGLWGFPGGHVDWGETALAAAARELREETGVIAEPDGYLTNLDLLRRDASGQVVSHYLLTAVACRYVSGEPVAADDARDARWFDCAVVLAGGLPTSERVGALLAFAQARRARA